MKKTHLLYALSIAASVSVLFSNSVIVLTPSIDKSFLVKVPRFFESTLDVDSYVITKISDDVIGTHQITKQVGCLPGDTLKTEGREIFCDETSLGIAKEFSMTGAPLKMTTFTGVIPDGYVYLKGTHIDSYDSRYFGLVKSNKTQQLLPIF